MDQLIYKICPRQAWAEAERTGTLELSAADRRDGFVHLSALHQVQATAEKHFAGQSDLLLLAVAVSRLPPGALRWERSRGGDEFPHLYAPLQSTFVISAEPLK